MGATRRLARPPKRMVVPTNSVSFLILALASVGHCSGGGQTHLDVEANVLWLRNREDMQREGKASYTKALQHIVEVHEKLDHFGGFSL